MDSNLIQDNWNKLVTSTKERLGRLARSGGANGSHASPERTQTDHGLRIEREKADDALAGTQKAINAEADQMVQRARDNADAVLVVAREDADALVVAASDKANHRQDSVVAPADARAILAETRGLEDEALRDERALADKSIQRERTETARLLERLLPIEREATDRYLLIERARSDDALANRDDFLGIVAHDLRDLLGGVVASAALLSSIASKYQERKQTLAETARIQRYAVRMTRLVSDLVDVASIDAGKLAVTRAPGDLALLVAELEDTCRAAALEKGVDLEIQAVERTLEGTFDHERILQVLANLISNSLKFTPRGGHVTVRAERAGAELRLCVSDTGPGIASDSLEAIFERFWQVGKNDRKGLGLGLYISRCIVEAHGGKIWAESTLGEGTRICFTLPG